MNRFRLLLLAAGAVVGLVVAAIAVAFNSSFQTWAARRAIAAQPDLRASVGALSAGTRHVSLRDLKFEQPGVLLVVPAVELDLPLISAGLQKKVLVSRLVAKGWTLELSTPGAGQPGVRPLDARGVAAPPITEVAAQAFAGLLGLLHVPFDLSVDGVDLDGEVILPEKRGRVKVTLIGGGVGAGKEGRFDLVAQATLADPMVRAVSVRGGIVAAMDTPRTFTRLSAKLETAATGTRFPQGVKVTSELSAARSTAGETYAVAVVADGQEVIHLQAELPRGGQKIEGSWKIDVRDADVAPFALGSALPAFTAVGEGRFDTDARFSTVHASGRLNTTADRLHVVRKELAVLGELKIAGEFDLAERDGTIVVRKLEAAIAAAQPVATVRALQGFEFNWKSGELRATDASRELFGIVLQGVPLAWAKPFLKDVEVSGGPLRGELAGSARGGGVALRSTSPLQVEGLAVARGGRALVEQLDVSFTATADYTPQGWQAEVGAFTASSGGSRIVSLAAKAGQLAGAAQAVKATGKLSVNLPALLRQPVAAGVVSLTDGAAEIDFVASLDARQEIQARVALTQLVTTADGKPVTLPKVSADLRADLAADGRLVFNAPVVLEWEGRKSDLTITGSIGPEKDQVRPIEAQLSSTQFVVNDAQLLAALAPQKTESKSESPSTTRVAGPPWAGWHGSVTLALQRVIYSETFEVTNLGGRLRIDAGRVKIEGLQAGLGDGGRLNGSGAVSFNGTVSEPFSLEADVAVRNFEVGPLFRAIDATRPATVEGRFDLASKLTGRAGRLSDLPLGAAGEFQLTSKGGVFRGLPVSVGNFVENTGKLSGWIASAGTALSSIAGKKDNADLANKGQAIAELARSLNPIPYDQLSVVLTRDAALNTTLRELALISPEVRLTGNGTALHRPGTGLLEDSLAMEFKLRARGRQGDLLKYLGVLEPQPDDLGYLGCTLPLKVGGTLAKVDTSELNARLAALALEKSGVTDKAADLVNRIFGGGK